MSPRAVLRLHGSCFPVLVISPTATAMLERGGTLLGFFLPAPGLLFPARGSVPQAPASQSLKGTQAGRPPPGVTLHPLWQLVGSAVMQNHFLENLDNKDGCCLSLGRVLRREPIRSLFLKRPLSLLG